MSRSESVVRLLYEGEKNKPSISTYLRITTEHGHVETMAYWYKTEAEYIFSNFPVFMAYKAI